MYKGRGLGDVTSYCVLVLTYMYSAWGTPFPHESPTKASKNMNKH